MIDRREVEFSFQSASRNQLEPRDGWFMTVSDVPMSTLEAVTIRVEDLGSADLPTALRRAADVLESLGPL